MFDQSYTYVSSGLQWELNLGLPLKVHGGGAHQTSELVCPCMTYVHEIINLVL